MGANEYMNWRFVAKCRKKEPDFFFPSAGRASNKAKEFCNNCPVITDCLEDALATDSDGIRAGLTYRERRAILRLRDKFNKPKTREIIWS